MPSAYFYDVSRADLSATARRVAQIIFIGIALLFASFVFFYSSFMKKTISFDKTLSSPLLRRAQDVFNDVYKKQVPSRYSHSNASVYHSNCYGFVNFLLYDVYPEAYIEIQHAMETLKDEIPPSVDGKPCPFNYSAALKKLDLSCWEVVTDLGEVSPGDILIYLPLNFKPKKTFKIGERPPSIHMMIVEEVISSHKGSYHFSIIDCTRVPHNRIDDTRYPKRNGVGRSSVFLKEWRKEYLLQWSPRGKSLKREIVGARLKHPL